ncbi:MAG TPA: twin-arginine translocation signal domain-containing protein [Pyrinomonadaceae bacterium]|nr:twin-arginine translocation signal domain-containing protein [Pyrinomonadaceae bacterium]
MTTSRRDFLKKGTLVALAAGVPFSLARQAAGHTAPVSSATLALTKAAFESQLNTQFLVNKGSKKVAVKLVNVSNLTGHTRFAGKEGFSLMFRGEAKALEQGTYAIEHQKLGLFSFLIVPVMRSRNNTQYYEAVINGLHP